MHVAQHDNTICDVQHDITVECDIMLDIMLDITICDVQHDITVCDIQRDSQHDIVDIIGTPQCEIIACGGHSRLPPPSRMEYKPRSARKLSTSKVARRSRGIKGVKTFLKT
jgi:hypothetical protein